jgi:sugar/nucleoside kinase (ribokinase family)
MEPHKAAENPLERSVSRRNLQNGEPFLDRNMRDPFGQGPRLPGGDHQQMVSLEPDALRAGRAADRLRQPPGSVAPDMNLRGHGIHHVTDFTRRAAGDKPAAKDAFRKAVDVAHKAGRKVSLTLSDSFCVGRHRAEFRDLVDNHVDILFANEHEITSLYEVDTFDAVLPHLRAKPARIAALTRSEKGSVVIGNGEVHAVPAIPNVKVVDTTGAGDLYAAGFLHGLTTGKDLGLAARLGAICAAEIISHYGARPETSLKELAAKQLAA